MNEKIKSLLESKRNIEEQINRLPYHGTPEIKTIDEKKYLYVRKRELNKVKSEYVGIYSDELYNLLINNQKKEKLWKKEFRKIEKYLAELGYDSGVELTSNVMLNIDFARTEMKNSIYDQAVLEGVATTYADTAEIIDNGRVSGMKAEDVLKIVNLKHAWEFIMDKDIVLEKSNFYIVSMINKFVNQGIYYNAGSIRNVPVAISGTSYIPPMVMESLVKEEIEVILNKKDTPIDTAIELALYVMKKQLFNDGNKRTGIIYANHYLISKGEGLLVVPFEIVKDFQKKLVVYNETNELNDIKMFFKEKCWKKLIK